MVRIIAPLVLTLILPACSIAPPSSVFSSLAKNDEQTAESARTEIRAEPKEEAGFGSSIGSLWDSVKSGFSGGSGKTEVSSSNSDQVTAVNPEEAQQLVNAYRAQKGLKPLRLNPLLSGAALVHSKDLAKSDRISHYGSDGSDSWDRVRRAGYDARMTAENVGTGQNSISEVFRGWQKSPDHDKNLLLADAEEMGIAMVHDPKTQFKTFWTLVISAPVGTQQVVTR